MPKDDTRDLIQSFMEGRVSRRWFVMRAAALGLSASTISGLLAACGGQMKPQTSAGKSAAGTPAGQSTSTGPVSGAVIGTPKATAEVGKQSSTSLWPIPTNLHWPKTVVSEPSSQVQLSVAHSWDAVFWKRQVQFDQLFMKRHPNIVIKAENTPFDNYLQKYTAQAAGGTLPDVMYCQFAWAQQFIGQGAFLALDDYIQKQPDFNTDDFTAPSLGFYKKGGKLYGVAYDCGPGMLYYNKDLFDKAGVKYPTSDWTLEDLKNAAIKLTSGSGPNKIYGLAGTPDPGDGGIGPTYLFPFGAQYVNEPEETKCLIDQPQAVKTMNWWMELRFKHQAVPSPATLQSLAWPAMQFGKIAMEMEGSWATPVMNQNAKFRWDIAMWPKGPTKHSTFAEGSCYAITNDTQHKDAAWIYLNEYLSSAGQTFMWASTGRGSPARRSAWPAYFQSKYAPPGAKLVLQSLDKFATNQVIYQPAGPRVTQTAGSIWDRVVHGNIGVKEGLDQICQRIDPLLAQNKG